MSKRQQAPGQLEHVRAFVNSVDIEQGVEELDSPAHLAGWLTEHGLARAELEADPADLRRAAQLRDALRELLRAHTDGLPPPGPACTVLDEVARRARVTLRFDQHGAAKLESECAGVDRALGGLLTIVHDSIADGTWPRLKACREHTCAWAFYDHTKNRSGTWCTMDVCGNRAKARSYRERRGPAQQTG